MTISHFADYLYIYLLTYLLIYLCIFTTEPAYSTSICYCRHPRLTSDTAFSPTSGLGRKMLDKGRANTKLPKVESVRIQMKWICFMYILWLIAVSIGTSGCLS